MKAEECSSKKALSNQLTANQSRDMKHKLVTSYSQKSVDNHIIYLPAKMSASSIKCVVRRTTRFLHFSFNKDHMSRRAYGSIPLVGSSKMITFNLNTIIKSF